MLSPFNPSAGVAAISASISLSASSLHIAPLAEAACSASNLESHSSNRNEITSSIPAVFRVTRNSSRRVAHAWYKLGIITRASQLISAGRRATHQDPEPHLTMWRVIAADGGGDLPRSVVRQRPKGSLPALAHVVADKTESCCESTLLSANVR